MRRQTPLWCALAAGLAGGGCLGAGRPAADAPFLPNPRAVVVSVDGAGGFEATSSALREAIAAEGVPVRVEAFRWSHGYGRVVADQVDCGHIQCAGQELAASLRSFRANCPGVPVYLVGHSAGCAVALAAAESVATSDIERLVLLAPSVSADYDLRPALSRVRSGLDVFYSRRDVGYLGLGVLLLGTADGHWPAAAAGRVGFRPRVECEGDRILYARLRQHGWDPAVEWSGNRGGHYDGYRTEFLRAYVLPLLAEPPTGRCGS